MACYSPLQGYRGTFQSSGSSVVCFKPSSSAYMPIGIPCGQCIGCRLDFSRQWAVRCVHEASLYDENCFITCTYRPEDLPVDGSLVKWHFQDFMKRLRKYYTGRRIRFYMCGEYGERLSRPHYHACLFNVDFVDKVVVGEDDGYVLYSSQILEDIWGFGFCSVCDVTFESAAYCARYVCKKVTGCARYEHYVNDDGVMLEPEFSLMSRGGKNGHGIGYEWYKLWGDEVFPEDEVYLRGAILKPPRYYSKMFEVDNPEGYELVKRKRNDFFVKHQEDCTPERLLDREIVKRAQVGQLKRSFEELV